jgi:ribosomal protein S18 acetylase RimI-like enzyme
MTQGNQKNVIYTSEYLSEKEYNEISQLQSLCYHKDRTNLKLELDYKLFASNKAKEKSESFEDQSTIIREEKVKNHINTLNTKQLNEFLYYVGGTLVAYLGISCFGGKIGEINGMTHPAWREKGIFHILFDYVSKECQGRNFSKVLLLTDENSKTGVAFIQSVGGIYDSSEYRMKLLKYPAFDVTSAITLRIAQKQDKKKIAMLNVIFFEDNEEDRDENDNEIENKNNKNVVGGVDNEAAPDEERIDGAPNTTIYMVELAGEVIGKIDVEYRDNTAFIYGFGILPDYRNHGYGRAALAETLRMIASKNIAEVGLDVVCTNSQALNLYIGCGFKQQSIMNYYRYPMKQL